MAGFSTNDTMHDDHLSHVAPAPDDYRSRERRRAQLFVAAMAHDPDDCRQLLTALGLLGEVAP